MKLLIVLFISAICTLGINCSPSNRILNGQHAINIPHACLVFATNPNAKFGLLGAGTLVSQRHILTAAQLLEPRDISVIELGCGGTKLIEQERRSTNTFVIHPQYDAEQSENDIGIVILSAQKQYEFSNTLSAVQLPQNENIMPLLNDKGIVAGFGFTDVYQTVANNELMYISNYIIDKKECQTIYRKLFASHFCAKDISSPTSGKVCKGDHGSGFYVNNNGIEELVGIASHFNGVCTSNNAPTAFTLVSKYRSWIAQFVGF